MKPRRSGPSGLAQNASKALARMIVAALALLPTMTPGMACGYDNPQAISLGALNWIYPDALHVRTAVWRAQDSGLLPARGKAPAAGLFALHRAAASMNKLGALLAAAQIKEPIPVFSTVLIPQVMWTRFVPGGHGVAVETHAPGPLEGEIVIVTGEQVVRALLDGSLKWADAETHGLIRIYGDQAAQAAVRAVLAEMMRQAGLPGTPITHASATRREGQ